MKVTIYCVPDENFITADLNALRKYYLDNLGAIGIDIDSLIDNNISSDDIYELLCSFEKADAVSVNSQLNSMLSAVKEERESEFNYWKNDYVIQQEIDIPVTISAEAPYSNSMTRQTKAPF